MPALLLRCLAEAPTNLLLARCRGGAGICLDPGVWCVVWCWMPYSNVSRALCSLPAKAAGEPCVLGLHAPLCIMVFPWPKQRGDRAF